MSHSYATKTYIVDTNSIPASFPTLEAFEDFKSSVGAIKHGEALCSVSGDTRGGWAIYATKALLEHGDFPAIAFLGDASSCQYSFEGEYGDITRITIVNPTQQAQVIADFERLISDLIKNPDVAYDIGDLNVYSDGDVEAALERDYVSSSPAFDKNVKGEDGESADYLFVFLRSILEVFKNAKSLGQSVVHVLYI
ncbi:hypothetical protein QWZ03_16570 [Chitinimonas viridis]|uniref:Uncharacterized protein n=1 Tax=Chitinimonas viridis TaxID=664880 RepID=A0ABT8B8K8_9NEIS|nr:hypothetical protein [Chitinimonas viridis]MDN3578385.1 hypothetical protein [Chitinimonas viridis]